MKSGIHVSLHDTFASNAGALLDKQWLADTLTPHCRIKRLNWPGSRLWMIQIPNEFASFLIFMAERKVQSYLEIGTSRGGSFYTADSYLRAAVDGYQRSVGYDRRNKIRGFPEYAARFPTAEFKVSYSQHINLGNERFDMAFIDARHVHNAVINDFKKVQNNCRFVAFHDIVLQKASVDTAWAEIKQGRKHWEFIDYNIPPEARCGIGVVEI